MFENIKKEFSNKDNIIDWCFERTLEIICEITTNYTSLLVAFSKSFFGNTCDNIECLISKLNKFIFNNDFIVRNYDDYFGHRKIICKNEAFINIKTPEKLNIMKLSLDFYCNFYIFFTSTCTKYNPIVNISNANFVGSFIVSSDRIHYPYSYYPYCFAENKHLEIHCKNEMLNLLKNFELYKDFDELVLYLKNRKIMEYDFIKDEEFSSNFLQRQLLLDKCYDGLITFNISNDIKMIANIIDDEEEQNKLIIEYNKLNFINTSLDEKEKIVENLYEKFINSTNIYSGPKNKRWNNYLSPDYTKNFLGQYNAIKHLKNGETYKDRDGFKDYFNNLNENDKNKYLLNLFNSIMAIYIIDSNYIKSNDVKINTEK